MRIDEIAVSGSVEIEVKLISKVLNFKSDVVFIKDDSVLINCIKSNDQTVGFSDRFQINFLYNDEGKLYVWENVSIKLVRYNGQIYHKVDLKDEGKPYNRREFFRLYIGEEMPIYVNTAVGPSPLTVLIKDISESGLGFITKEEFDLERTIRFKLKHSNFTINLTGVIVRKEFLEHLDKYIYGCKFLEKNNILGKYIARRQGELMKQKVSPPATMTKMNIAKKKSSKN